VLTTPKHKLHSVREPLAVSHFVVVPSEEIQQSMNMLIDLLFFVAAHADLQDAINLSA
jgi:hypothetical protein